MHVTIQIHVQLNTGAMYFYYSKAQRVGWGVVNETIEEKEGNQTNPPSMLIRRLKFNNLNASLYSPVIGHIMTADSISKSPATKAKA